MNVFIRKRKILKFFWWLIGSIVFVGGISSYFLVKYYWKPTQIVQKNKKFSVSIDGAVENPGDYIFDKPLSIREIIFRANVKTIADISTLELDKLVSSNISITVPFLIGSIQKIHWKDLKNIDQLIFYGVKKKIAQKIIDFRRKNLNPKWEQIHAIKGIGITTLNQLKDIIEIS